MLFTCIKSRFFRNHLANFHQISHWSFCWNVIDCLFKWSCSIDCQAHIFFFKTKNCSNDDIFISCDDRIGKMLHNIYMSAVAMSLRWANCGPWASCFYTPPHNSGRVLWFHVGSLWVRPSYVCLSVLSVFRFQMITWVNINVFSPNLVCALILWFGIANGQISSIFMELSAQDTPILTS